LAGCVAPTNDGLYQRVARIDDVSVRAIPGESGAYRVSVRGTADGSGWSQPELRWVSAQDNRTGDMTLALFARAPDHVIARGYQPERAYGGDTYFPPETDRWPSGRPAIDTYFAGGDPLEAHLIVTPGTDHRNLRVLGRSNEAGGVIDALASARLGSPRPVRRHEWYLDRRPLVEIGAGEAAIVTWNGQPLADKAALEAKLLDLATRPRLIEVRVRPVEGASTKRVADVMSTLSRYSVAVHLVGSGRSQSVSEAPIRTDPTEPASPGFYFSRGVP
jgi:hypothetical protein